MAFDLSQHDTKTAADQGVFMPVLNPRTRLPEKNDDGSIVGVTVHGRQSESFRLAMIQVQRNRAEIGTRGETVSQDQIDKEDIAILSACTVSWTIQSLDGAPFPCTTPNIRRLWSDPRFATLRAAAMAFVLNDANFLPDQKDNSEASSPSSRDSPATTSSLPVRSLREAPSEIRSTATG